jgi:hypothetical protein
MDVAIGAGDLASSPVHVAFRAGGEWMHANRNTLGAFRFTTHKTAQWLATRVWFTRTVPILYPAAVNALRGKPAFSCVTGLIHAVFTGWFGGCN